MDCNYSIWEIVNLSFRHREKLENKDYLIGSRSMDPASRMAQNLPIMKKGGYMKRIVAQESDGSNRTRSRIVWERLDKFLVGAKKKISLNCHFFMEECAYK